MISVVMPAYNSARDIQRAIESVLRQTYRDFELLVCDDGSVDGTIELVERMQREDDRIRLLRHCFRSVSLNCNAGMQAARYPWIARLDADDIMLPHRLQRQITAATNDPSVVLWGSHVGLIDRQDKLLRAVRSGPETEQQFRAMRDAGAFVVIQGPSVMFRRDLALALGGYDRRFDSAEDIELLHRMMLHGSLRVIPEVLTLYRLHGSSFTASRDASQQRLFGYIKHRNEARIAGHEPIGFDDFMQRMDDVSALGRAVRRSKLLAGKFYRRARLNYADGQRLQAALCFALSILFNPARMFRRGLPHIKSIGWRRLRGRERPLATMATVSGELTVPAKEAD